MIINLFFKNKLLYNDIENISNILLTTISSIVYINCIYDNYYKETIQLLSIYLFIELFFLPLKKIDTIIHHFFTLCNCYYVLFLHPIDLTNNFYSAKNLLLTERSSIFLGLSEIFKNTTFGNISKALFVLLFFKTRIYDYIYNILLSQYFYDSLGSDPFLRNWQYMCTYGLFSLQLYWSCIILKIISKQFLKNLPLSYSEYILQYTYFLNFFTTAISYSYLLGNNENKIIYGMYSLLDVASNGLISISSYYYHNHIYYNANKINYSILNFEHKNKLLFDLFCIDIRILGQFFANIYMHNLELHQRYFHFFSLIYIFVFELSIVDSIYYHHIQNKRQHFFPNNINNLLILLEGLPPFIGILLSTYNIPDTNIILNTIMQVYLIILFSIIQPFYNSTQIGIHLVMCLINYQLVINNTYFIRNELEMIE